VAAIRTIEGEQDGSQNGQFVGPEFWAVGGAGAEL
jgi:hypothetical protein